MLERDQQLGHYKIYSQIGAGGMGEVYLAEDTRLNRKVALKVLASTASRSQNSLDRFKQEAFAASALNHPNILTVYEFTEQNGLHLLATEFVQGRTLRDRLNSRTVDFEKALDVAQQVAFALAATHSAGIVHRDIKPENIMLRDDGIVKVLDFGLAKLAQKQADDFESQAKTQAHVKTQAGTLLGTVFYMSPEQVEGEALDGRTDIWSLGVVLYEMLTGKMPFAAATMTEILTSVLTKEPKPPSEFNPKISAALEHIINKSLTKKKEERYQTAKDLLIDLRKLQWRMEFEAELNRSSASDKQSEDTLRISEVDVTEIISNVQPNNLSAEFPPIIGREKEIAEIKSLLKRQNVRLVTLTGIGGAGKTSLAKAVARRILADFADGVFFIELSAITSTELVAPTIAQSLDVKEAGGKSVFEVLKDYLRDKQILLVIDNFEQIVNAAPQIAELISAADKLKVLITSRVLLRLTAEREFVVPPLSMPDGSKQISVDELFKYEAIKLFIERAQNIKPSFDLQPDNAPTVAKICERLEGLPLAIELAAARVKLLSPQSILAKLENRLKLLTGGARDLPARQQTMRGAVEWSYDLLTNEEKCLFRHLAVFAGGFTLEAAEAVVSCRLPVICEGEIYEQKTIEIEPLTIDTLDGITSLVDKSLLNSKEQNGGEVRFRMLEVVREYALELSGMSGEAEAMRRSHAEYFLAFAEEAEPHLQAANAVEWLNRLEEEHDNLRAALRWLLQNDAQKAARLAASIRMLWTLHSHLTEGCGWLEAALERGKNVIPSEVRFELLNGLGLAMRQKGDYETAREIYEEALTAGKMADNLRQIAHSHRSLGLVVFQQGDFTAARKFLEEGLAISRQIDDRAGIAIALNFLGDLLRNESNDAAARLIFEESLAISRQLGNKEVIICNLLNLGFVAFGEKDFITAKSHFAEALSTAQELGYKILIACSLDGFAALAVEQGETETAVKLASAAETFRESIGYEIERVDRRFREAYLSKIKAKMSEEDFKKANEQGQLIKLEQAITLILDLKRVLQ